MAFNRTRENTAHEHNNLPHDQFGHRARIAIRCVKNRNPVQSGRFQINLIGADAEATNSHKTVSAFNDFLGQLRAGTDAHNMHAFERLC